MSGILAVSVPVGLFLSIVFIERSAILFGGTRLPVLSVLLFVVALLHNTNIRLSTLTSILFVVVLRGLIIGVLSLGVNVSSLDSFLLNIR